MRDLPGVAPFRAHTLTFVLLLLAVPVVAAPSTGPPAVHAVSGHQNPPSTDQGRSLFVGGARMRNGGPPCGSCHSISSLPFPGGGQVGPDLSGIANALGPEGMDVTLQTLFFPTMMPLYEKRPLTPTEQRALKAFLEQAGTTPSGSRDTLWLAVLAAGGFVVLIAATWIAWHTRLRGVRAPLVASVQRR